MQNAVAFANNDVATIAWSYGKRPEGCMGFAIYRIDDKGFEEALPSHAVFKGYQIKRGQKTNEFPIQKFYWKDPYARLIAERTGNRTFRYKVVPMEGPPGSLKPMANLPFLVSNEVTVSAATSAKVSAFFNRGLISTQRVSRAFNGRPAKGPLVARVENPSDRLMESLSGDLVEALTGFVDRAKSSGKIYAALYELGDEELVAKLEKLGKRLQIVLSSAIVTDKKTKKKSDTNDSARRRLAKTAGLKHDRIMPSNHIGHNKFLVYVDKNRKAQAVLLGSTNWTSTGLCTQTNNALIIEDAKLAERYLAYWKQLAADTKAAKGNPKALQGATLRLWDTKGKDFALGTNEDVENWFAPNTAKARNNKAKNEKCPPDMAAVIDRINNAKHSILFLLFYPGMPSVATWAAAALRANTNLFVRGCVTNRSASGDFYYQLKGMTPPKKVKGIKTPTKQDPRVIGAEALGGDAIPTGWMKEILSAGHAIVHDKIVVIDPFSDDCVVVTGSHNLGYKASYDNDENLVIVEGNKNLAVAYATHVLDVYDHFAWRYLVKRDGKKRADQSLKSTPAEWLDKYFYDSGNVKNAQLKFWMQASM